jgi:WD40 repeat protein
MGTDQSRNGGFRHRRLHDQHRREEEGLIMLRMNGLAVAVIAGALLLGQESFAQGPPDIIYEREGANAATIDFSPDGRFLATGGLRAMNPFTSGQIKFWSAPDGVLLTTITENGTLGYGNDVQFSPDGQRVVSANGTVDCVPDAGCFASRPGQFVWSFPAGTMLATSPPEGVPRGIDHSPDGTLIATAEYFGSEAVKIYDTDLQLIRTLPGHPGGSFAVRFSPDGEFLASGGEDGSVRLWRVSDGALVREFPGEQPANPRSVGFSPDGSLLIAGYSGFKLTIRVWRVSDGETLHSIPADPDSSSSNAAFTPDGRHFAGGTTSFLSGRGAWVGIIRFWRTSDGQLVQRYEEDRLQIVGIGGFAISPGGATFAYGYGDRLILARTPAAARKRSIFPISGL